MASYTMSCCSSIYALIFLVAISHLVAATDQESSPQYLYMEHLRKLTRTMPESMDNAGDDDSQIPGTLLATSIKDTCK
jgi:hypothetical protein